VPRFSPVLGEVGIFNSTALAVQRRSPGLRLFCPADTHRRENITDGALQQFRSHYADPSITKWDIFHYVYAVLHHPDYRQRYGAHLRRELPRIPFVGTGAKAPDNATSYAGLKPGSSTGLTSGTAREAAVVAGTAVEERPFKGRVTKGKRENSTALPKAVAGGQSPQATGATTDADVFRTFVKAGQRLAGIHVHYEQQPECPLAKIEKKGAQLDYRVTKMKLSKDKTQLVYEYRLGNRPALEWIIDQYQVSTDKRSGITNDPNREDDPQYILRLLGQVTTGSLETMKLVKGLPQLHNRQQTSTSRQRCLKVLHQPSFAFNHLAPSNPHISR
jgi:Type ISP C-terminal specificity domain